MQVSRKFSPQCFEKFLSKRTNCEQNEQPVKLQNQQAITHTNRNNTHMSYSSFRGNVSSFNIVHVFNEGSTN